MSLNEAATPDLASAKATPREASKDVVAPHVPIPESTSGSLESVVVTAVEAAVVCVAVMFGLSTAFLAATMTLTFRRMRASMT